MIIYLHGFCSSPASWKSTLLAETMAQRGRADRFCCPVLSPSPVLAVAEVSRLIEASQTPVTLVGSSLGGHYASYLAEQYALNAVLINPAVIGAIDVRKFIGEHANFHTGETFHFSAEHAAQLQAQVIEPTPARYWLLLETGDAVLDYHAAQAFWFGCRQNVLEGGDHSFTRFPEFIPKILEFAGI